MVEPLGNRPTPIEIGTHSFKQLYLYAFATRGEVNQYLRTQSVNEKPSHITQILGDWAQLQADVNSLIKSEQGLPDKMEIKEIPGDFASEINKISTDPLFLKTFSNCRFTFNIIEIDKLIAPQRTVNLDYVNKLKAEYPHHPILEDLISICLSVKRKMDPIQHLEIGASNHVFSSPNSDIRFLGAFAKQLTAEDLQYAEGGGVPVAAVIAFVGYGVAPVNVLLVNNRVVLSNGFHRVYALRDLGVTHIPVVIQHINNVQLEFPPQMLGLPREYLLGSPRPVLMKDFFETKFTISLNVQERLKTVTVSVNASQYEVPA